ncbi:MAG: hypothetical protein QOD74_2376, partial [Variibacter sp.]|nr:hypothetical protein [Variibacter sp.]
MTRRVLVALTALLLTTFASLAQDWPAKPVRL